ncbi:MAG: hypothetical protein ABL870_07195 [Sediminibacterium sp.]
MLHFYVWCLCCECQTWQINGQAIQKNIVNLKNGIDFIKAITGQELSPTNLVLKNAPKIFKRVEYFDEILKFDYYLKKEEWLQIRAKKMEPPMGYNAKEQVATDSISQLKSWPYFYLNLGNTGMGNNIYYYSVPIFLRNNSYCIFYFINQCGPDCGMADFAIYIRNDTKWIKLKTYKGWLE